MADEDDEMDSVSDEGGDDEISDAPAPAAKPINPIVRRYLDNKRQLAEAQEQTNKNELLTGLARAGASLSRGIAHSSAPVNEEAYKEMSVADQQPVTNVLSFQKGQAADLANQKALMDAEKEEGDHDPNSPSSVAAKNMIKRLYPGKFDDATLEGLSKSDIGDSLLKPLELDQKIKEHADEMKAKAADRAQSAAEREDKKRDADQDKALHEVNALLESARGNPAAAQAERDIYAAQKAKSLASMYGDPNNMSERQVNLLVSEIGKIAQGGVPSMHELDGLTPNALYGKLSRVWEKLSNDRSPANAAAFVKEYMDYANSITKDAQKVIEDKYGRVIETNRGRLGESNYRSLRANYLDRFKHDAADDSASSGGDHSARAAKILAQRQMQKQNQDAVQGIVPTPNYVGQPAAPQGAPSLLVPPNQNAVAGDQQFAFGGRVQAPPPPQAPDFHQIRQHFTPKLPTLKAPNMAPKAPATVMPAMDRPMTRPAHFACGGEVHGYADGGQVPNPLDPDPQLAREAMAGAEKGGPSMAEAWQNLKNEIGLNGKQPPKKNYTHGGTVAGEPPFPHQNTPANDVVDGKLTPKEEVLPLTVTQSKSPALAAYLHMKSKGYK